MRLTDPNEEQALMAKAKAGDAAAFEAVVRTFQGPIYRLCRRMTWPRRPSSRLTGPCPASARAWTSTPGCGGLP
jgi:hypothetical protein